MDKKSTTKICPVCGSPIPKYCLKFAKGKQICSDYCYNKLRKNGNNLNKSKTKRGAYLDFLLQVQKDVTRK